MQPFKVCISRNRIFTYGMSIMCQSTEIIKGKDLFPQSHSLYIIMVGVSYRCPGEMRISVARQYPMSWSCFNMSKNKLCDHFTMKGKRGPSQGHL